MSDMAAWIMQKNIQRFNELLGHEQDDERRKTLAALLEAEQNGGRYFSAQYDRKLLAPTIKVTSMSPLV